MTEGEMYSYEIRQGKRTEYQILRYGLESLYRVAWRNPDSWFSNCYDALTAIDSDVQHRRSVAMGWIPVSCDEQSRQHDK